MYKIKEEIQMLKKLSTIPFQGTAEQEKKLAEVIDSHKHDKSLVMAVMQEAQGIYGYLPMEVQMKIAEGMDVPLEKVYGIATFYAQFSLLPRVKTTFPSVSERLAMLKAPVTSTTSSKSFSESAEMSAQATENSRLPLAVASVLAVLPPFLPLTKRFTAVSAWTMLRVFSKNIADFDTYSLAAVFFAVSISA